MSGATGAGRLIRLALRRDRIQLPVWIAGSAALIASGAAAVQDEFPTEAERLVALRAAGANAAVALLRGTPTGVDLGAMITFRNFVFAMVLAALMSTFAVVRHTRQNEETGRAELIGAGAVGRQALLAAALAVAAGANVLLGLVLTGVLVGFGLPATGSLAFGAAGAVAGIGFAGVAAVTAQLFTGARAANGLAATLVGVDFLLRGLGDAFGTRQPDGLTVVSAWPSWLSPLGWGTQIRPYGDDRWWVLLLPLAFAGALAAAAFALAARRDVGFGLFPDRPGPATAAPGLRGTLGLAWRLHRGAFVGWLAGLTAFGVVVGSLGRAVTEAFSASAGAAEMLGQLAGGAQAALVDAYFAAMMNVVGSFAAGYVVQALLRLRAEESAGAAEGILAGAVARVRWAGSHLFLAAAGAAAMLLCAGLGAGLTDAAVGGGAGIGTLTGAALAQLPAALVLAGFVLLLFGGLPRLVTALAWAAFTVCLAAGLFGDLFGLPQAVRDVSPFSHVPAVPAVPFAVTPEVTLAAVAVALAAAGLALFRRRDLTP